jgi:hypothetical protein
MKGPLDNVQWLRRMAAVPIGGIVQLTPEKAHEIAHELALLRGEIKEWVCLRCRCVYPGPPSTGFTCIICSRCGGSTGPLNYMLLREASEKIEQLERKTWSA